MSLSLPTNHSTELYTLLNLRTSSERCITVKLCNLKSTNEDSRWQQISSRFLERTAKLQIIDSMEVSAAVASHVSSVNQLLGAASTRLDGLRALESTLKLCTLDVLNDNASNWLVQLLKCLRSGDSGSWRAAKVRSSNQLLRAQNSVVSLAHQFLRSYHPLTDAKIKEESLPAIFDCLTVIVKNFRGPAFPSKKVLDSFILSHFDVEDQSIVSALTSCFAQLPQIGGSGMKGTNHRQAWIQQTNELIAAIRGTTQRIYGEAETEVSLALPLLAGDDPLMHIRQLANRYANLSLALAKMLSEPFPAPKCVPVESILLLCGEVLCLSPMSLSKRTGGATTEGRERQRLLPDMQVSALQVLCGLILACRKQLIPHGRTISKFALQILQWSHTPNDLRISGCDRPFSKVRIAAYNMLTLWIKAAQTGSRVEKVLDELSTEMFSDIRSDKDVVTLQKAEISAKKKKGTLAYDVVKPIERHIKHTANADVCRAALELLDRIVRALSTLATSTFYQQAQEIIIPLILEIEAGVETAPIPYAGSGACRRSLYRCLEALTIAPHPLCPAPYSYAIAAFSHGQDDPDIEVAALCADALNACERAIHPLIPAMSFPLELTPQPEKVPESEKTSGFIPLWESFHALETMEPPRKKAAQEKPKEVELSEVDVATVPQLEENSATDVVSNASSSPDHTNFDSDVDITDTPINESVVKATATSPDMPLLVPVTNQERVVDERKEVLVAVDESVENVDSPVGSDVEEMLADFVDAVPE